MLVADFAIVVAVAIVQTCLAHAALYGGRTRQHPPAGLRWQLSSALSGQLLFSAFGTFETCRLTLRMSVNRGIPEVISARSK